MEGKGGGAGGENDPITQTAFLHLEGHLSQLSIEMDHGKDLVGDEIPRNHKIIGDEKPVAEEFQCVFPGVCVGSRHCTHSPSLSMWGVSAVTLWRKTVPLLWLCLVADKQTHMTDVSALPVSPRCEPHSH